MHQFYRDYLELATESECPAWLHLWSAISVTSAVLSRNVGLVHGNSTLYPNLYVVMVGDPGTRKSTAIKLAKKVLKLSGYDSFAGDKVTMQKFLLDLAGVTEEGETLDRNLPLDKVTMQGLGFDNLIDREFTEQYIAIDEFIDYMGINNYPFIALLGNFWDIDTDYEYRIKSSKSLLIPKPTINILGGTTPAQFNTMFPAAISGQGFLSRLLLVHARSTGKKIPFPMPSPPEVLAKVANNFKQLRRVQGEARLTPVATALLGEIYKKWSGVGARFETYETRRFTQLLKLCVVFAASRGSLEVSEADVITANTTLTYTERHMEDAVGMFGKAENSDVMQKIFDLVGKAHRPVKIMEVWKAVQRDLPKMTDCATLLSNLVHGDKLQMVDGGYLPVRNAAVKKTDEYVDWKLLKGFVPDGDLI